MEKPTAIVVGTGFGCRVHVPALRAAGFAVAALVGTRPDRLERKAAEASVPAFFTDLGAAIERTGAHLVTIAAPPASHAPLAFAAMARGCHVLCEKPFAIDAAEGAALLDAAERAGIVHMIAHEFRWLPERALLGRAIAEGLIGTPRFLAMDQFIPFCADPGARLPGWWFDTASGGGWLGAGGSHLIDQVRTWLGEFESVSARLLTVSDRENGADDSYSLRFRLASGAEGSMQQSAGAWGAPASLLRCAGTRGTVWIESGKVLLADRTGTRELPVPDDLVLPAAPGFELAPFIRLCEALRARIEGAGGEGPVAIPTFRDGLAAMRVMDAVRASSAAGGALRPVEPASGLEPASGPGGGAA
ncbi:Gfo/Idh/MocA family oxidoreductase [Novosphingobium sp. ST904]|uniref:Gfo/Idh/MocA family protein n=1 Tax=Novosphingobium sp. ST904 TaxID=1684385 RepID=UPI0009EAB6E4|nr:Gfo/Idh/MocA family oxidoreductase [Novosphingobium sp. ST904]TCM34383.1 putative dehydrogenase [Novosphingobium sp. ST904]